MKLSQSIGLIAFFTASCAPTKIEKPEIDGPTFRPSSRGSVSAIVVGELPPGVRRPVTTDRLAASQTLWTMRGLSLKLDLIDRNRRTTSPVGFRYTLADQSGGVLVSAESGLSSSDIGPDWNGRIHILEDASTMTLLVAEEHGRGYGRCILMRPADSRGATANPWTLRYVRIPMRQNAEGFDVVPRLMGIKGDKLYVNQSGNLYALPLDGLQSEPSR